jgi:hypothetical protein
MKIGLMSIALKKMNLNLNNINKSLQNLNYYAKYKHHRDMKQVAHESKHGHLQLKIEFPQFPFTEL